MACNGARGFKCLAIWKNGKKEFKYLEFKHFIPFTHTQNFLPKSSKFPQTYLKLILCTPSLIASFIFFFILIFFFFYFSLFFSFAIHSSFLDLGVQTFLSQLKFPFSQCTYIYTPLTTVLILTTNEMYIISRFR